jgi:hypothetical protein
LIPVLASLAGGEEDQRGKGSREGERGLEKGKGVWKTAGKALGVYCLAS